VRVKWKDRGNGSYFAYIGDRFVGLVRDFPGVEMDGFPWASMVAGEQNNTYHATLKEAKAALISRLESIE